MKKHILFVSSWYPTPEKKSHGIFFKRHAEAASLVNHISAIHVYSANEYKISSLSENNVFTILGTYKKVKIQIPVFSNLLRLWRSLICFIDCYKTLLKKNGPPNLVLLNVIFPAAIFVLWLHYFKKIQYIIQEQWSGYYPEDGNYKGFFTKKITAFAVKNAREILVVSSKLEQSMLAHGLKNKYSKIGNVVDTELFIPRTTKIAGIFCFVHVSTVNDKEKNITGIIEAAKILSLKNISFRIDIVGDGPERESFETLAKKLQLLNNCIFFHGFKLPHEVATIIGNSHCFVLNSNYEGLPCVLLEAMSCGLPVIATHVGAVPEIISSKQGIVISPNNKDQLAHAMEEMILKYSSYQLEHIRNEVILKYAYPAIANDFDKIFNRVLGHE
ncbi:MAG TPA: glycosyltransferase [Bacteroidia bacterium]|nr:glycosyltransferase [Bacteroidia bacterium]